MSSHEVATVVGPGFFGVLVAERVGGDEVAWRADFEDVADRVVDCFRFGFDCRAGRSEPNDLTVTRVADEYATRTTRRSS